ncbi:CheB methylesterase domain-containing protein [Pseudogemmobacter faecipullorum]|uniref:protein-glutamate methylesterase n=1 Tax=Pseudogemmobacter faecipullorum TaxID=2755041 RepID=A0ABS8CLK7_9RHOB|nr:CheB methylesterase domain-containing protein [Pseudogemmobacter faecipullorum]MCB5410260.1 chemotaxis protein CheB [Pseudogemmobacter faecipullorum]
MKPRKVVLATSRAITAARLSRRISALPDYLVCGQAADLSAAYILAESCEPHLLLIGAELTRQADFDGLLALLRVIGIAWKTIPDRIADPEGRFTFPEEGDTASLLSWLSDLPAPQSTPPPPAPSAPAQAATPGFLPDRIILIGASTGGIDALLTILASFPPDCPPTVIVQHTGAAFSDSLIRLFARCAAARVVAATAGLALRPGMIMVGAGCAGHLRLDPSRPWRSDLSPGAPVSGHLPSIDVLFRSAVPFGASVSAALLTGMGRDGARGLLDLRQAGATTFAQDEASSTVYGMPRAAAELGAACETLPLSRIAAALLASCHNKPVSLVR